MRRIVIGMAGAVAALLATAGRGQESTEPYPGEFGRFGAAARPLGLGEAFTAVGDPTAPQWNAAALGNVRRGTFHVSHRQLQSSQRIDTGNLALRPRRFERMALGITATLLQRDAADTGTSSPQELAGSVGTAFHVAPNLAFGAEVGRVESTVHSSEVVTGWNTGAGMLWSSGPTAVGVAIRGAAFGMHGESGTYPYRYRLSAGVAHHFDSTLLFAAQVDRDRAVDPVLGMGAEWTPDTRLAVRGGVRQSLSDDLAAPLYSGGVGLQGHGVSLDYAARFSVEQAPEHVMSMSYHFGAGPVLAEATPQVAAPAAAAPIASVAVQEPADEQPIPAAQQLMQRPQPAAPPGTDAEPRAAAPPESPQRFVVRAGVHLDMQSAKAEVARFDRAKLRTTIERRGRSHVVVVVRCETYSEARFWVRHAAEHGLRCYIDEE